MNRRMNSATKRAWMAVIGFSLAGIIGFTFVAPDGTRIVWPEILFYALLVLNTFFSVRLFASIMPEDRSQMLVDTVLVVCYIGLALSLGREWAFPFFALCIFVAAPIKYALVVGSVPYSQLLRKKLIIDLLGAALCAFALLGAVFLNYPLTTAWLFATIFALANIYVLVIRPLYRL